MSFCFHQSTPSWQGMMHLLHKECEYPGKSSVQFLPMIDMNPGDKTCILSTLNYLCSLSSKHNMPTIITFDQPLFWKASEITKLTLSRCSPIRNVILLLGSFHYLHECVGCHWDFGGSQWTQGDHGDSIWWECCRTHDEWKGSAMSVSWSPAGGSVPYTSDCCQNRGGWPWLSGPSWGTGNLRDCTCWWRLANVTWSHCWNQNAFAKSQHSNS